MILSKGFKWCVSLTALLFVGLMISVHQDDFKHLMTQLDWPTLVMLIGLQTGLIGLSGYPFYVLVGCFGTRVHWHHWVGLSFIANMLNQLIPYRPGIAFRYLYLKKHYNLSFKIYSFVTVFYFMMLIICSSLMVLFPATLSDHNAFNDPMLVASWALFGAVICLGLVHTWFKKMSKSQDQTQKKLIWIASLKKILSHPKSMALSCTGFIILQLMTVMSFYLIFLGLGYPIPTSHLLVIVGLVTLGFLFPITPGNLGILEVMLGGLTESLYGQFGLGFSALLIFRIAQLSVALIFGSFFSYFLLGHLPSINKSAQTKQ